MEFFLYNILVTVLAYTIDAAVGGAFFRYHPLSALNDLVLGCKKALRKMGLANESLFLVVALLVVSGVLSFFVAYIQNIGVLLGVVFEAFFASVFLSNTQTIYTKQLQTKTLLQVYTNLVTAPLLYLLFFGLVGLVLYKTVQMAVVATQNNFAAKSKKTFIYYLEVWLNYIPLVLTKTFLFREKPTPQTGATTPHKVHTKPFVSLGR